MKIDDESIQHVLRGEIPLDVKKVLIQARELTSKNIFTLAFSLIIILAMFFIFGLFLVNHYDIKTMDDIQQLQTQGGAIIGFVSTLVTAPLWAGVTMMSLRSLQQSPIKISHVFAYYPLMLALGLAALIVSIFLEIGLALLILPGLYVFIASAFVAPLIVERKLGPISAIVLSIKVTNAYFNKIAMIYLVLLLLMIVVIFSFGLAYFLVGPYYFNVKAVLYQTLLVNDKPEKCENGNDTSATHDSGIFNA
ncbi:hypothetical protein [Agaribacter marinus]|uniref:Uncharacterized protein n=1 Tax=Agaribacter marinus TaxID=1431249 RepID=A0AA37WHM7_9ALTE|nr:hypothetical protein [Agaribacter marinus]GLR70037.1 hypothetical protein GCM10007852_09450 [Agaribacter marinus]